MSPSLEHGWFIVESEEEDEDFTCQRSKPIDAQSLSGGSCQPDNPKSSSTATSQASRSSFTVPPLDEDCSNSSSFVAPAAHANLALANKSRPRIRVLPLAKAFESHVTPEKLTTSDNVPPPTLVNLFDKSSCHIRNFLAPSAGPSGFTDNSYTSPDIASRAKTRVRNPRNVAHSVSSEPEPASSSKRLTKKPSYRPSVEVIELTSDDDNSAVLPSTITQQARKPTPRVQESNLTLQKPTLVFHDLQHVSIGQLSIPVNSDAEPPPPEVSWYMPASTLPDGMRLHNATPLSPPMKESRKRKRQRLIAPEEDTGDTISGVSPPFEPPAFFVSSSLPSTHLSDSSIGVSQKPTAKSELAKVPRATAPKSKKKEPQINTKKPKNTSGQTAGTRFANQPFTSSPFRSSPLAKHVPRDLPPTSPLDQDSELSSVPDSEMENGLTRKHRRPAKIDDEIKQPLGKSTNAHEKSPRRAEKSQMVRDLGNQGLHRKEIGESKASVTCRKAVRGSIVTSRQEDEGHHLHRVGHRSEDTIIKNIVHQSSDDEQVPQACDPPVNSRTSAQSASIKPRIRSTPMSELIQRVNSLPGSPFAGCSRSLSTYTPYLKSSRSLLSRIATLHPNRRTPPPPLPRPPPPKKTKKRLEMEERIEEELSETIDVWSCMTDEERRDLRRARIEVELGDQD